MKTFLVLSALMLLGGCTTPGRNPGQDFVQVIPCNKDNCGKRPMFQ